MKRRYDPAVSVGVRGIEPPIFTRELWGRRDLGRWMATWEGAEAVQAARAASRTGAAAQDTRDVWSALEDYLASHHEHAPDVVPSAAAALRTLGRPQLPGECAEYLAPDRARWPGARPLDISRRPAQRTANEAVEEIGLIGVQALTPVVCTTRNAAQSEWYYRGWALFDVNEDVPRFVGVFCPTGTVTLPSYVFLLLDAEVRATSRNAFYYARGIDYFAAVHCSETGEKLVEWGNQRRPVHAERGGSRDEGMPPAFPPAGPEDTIIGLREHLRSRRRAALVASDPWANTRDMECALPRVAPLPWVDRAPPPTGYAQHYASVRVDETAGADAVTDIVFAAYAAPNERTSLAVYVPRRCALAVRRAGRLHVRESWRGIQPVLLAPVSSCAGADGVREHRAAWLAEEDGTIELHTGRMYTVGDTLVGLHSDPTVTERRSRRTRVAPPGSVPEWCRAASLPFSPAPLVLFPNDRAPEIVINRERDDRFSRSADVARQFAEAHGHLRPSKRDRPEGINLYMWLKNQEIRIAKGTLPPDRRAILEALPHWNERYAGAAMADEAAATVATRVTDEFATPPDSGRVQDSYRQSPGVRSALDVEVDAEGAFDTTADAAGASTA